MIERSAPKILIIEDDADARELMVERINSHFGCETCDARGALRDLIGYDLSTPDMMLCDLHLPDGQGLQALRTILARRDDLPVVIVTGEREVGSAVEAIRLGASDYIVKSSDYLVMLPIVIEKNLEAARLRRDNLRLHSALASSLAELKRKNRELEQFARQLEEMASTDLLTNLGNRRRLDEQLHLMFAEAVRYGRDLSCIMIDLDEFKTINDTRGHQTGDLLLRTTGEVITGQVRASDVAARFGGDEFIIVLPETAHETAAALARRLQDEFGRRAEAALGESDVCGMSIGISSLALSNPLEPAELIAHADAALYAAKGGGKSRVMICKPGSVDEQRAAAEDADADGVPADPGASPPMTDDGDSEAA